MKFLYGTSNFSKHMKQMFKGLNIDLYGLSDLGINIKVDESGSTPMDSISIDIDTGKYIIDLDYKDKKEEKIKKASGIFL